MTKSWYRQLLLFSRESYYNEPVSNLMKIKLSTGFLEFRSIIWALI